MGGSQREGKVEVYYNGTWRTLCDMDLAVAGVICRQLGFPGATSSSEGSSFQQGQGTVAIKFDDLSCSNVESSLFSCPHSGVRNDYRRDRCYAGVGCKLQGEKNTEAENE